jgi:hypothetical protein
MTLPPYCLDCEAMLTAADWSAAPLCLACMQRVYDEAAAEVEAEEALAWARGFLEPPMIKWGRFWTADGWVWLHPMEFVDWCLGAEDDAGV